MPATLRYEVAKMMLAALPQELACLVKDFLALDDIIVLVGSVEGSATSHGLQQFLPTVEELDALVPCSSLCLRSERRKRRSTTRATHITRRPSLFTNGLASCANGTSCVYHNHGLRNVLLKNVVYDDMVRTKLDASEAIGHLCGSESDLEARQHVAIDILDSHMRRRQLNRVTLVRTLVSALRLSLHQVVDWILQVPMTSIPPRYHIDVVLASCEYEKLDVGRRIVEMIFRLTHPSSQLLQCGLVAAASNGRLGIVQLFFDELNARGQLGTEALASTSSAAAGGGHGDILHLAISIAQTRAQVLDATEALVSACRSQNYTIVGSLLASSHTTITATGPLTPLAAAVEGGDPRIVMAINSDPRVNTWDPLAFQRAAGDGNVDIVKQLLAHEGCRPKDVDIAFRSILRMTARWDIVQELAMRRSAHPVDVWELLDAACAHGMFQVIEHVLATSLRGDDLSDRKYWRPLVTAARNGHAEVVRRILEGSGVWRILSAEHSLDSHTEKAEALLAACHRGHLHTAQQLIHHVGVDMIQLLRIVEAAAAAPSSAVLCWMLSDHSATISECDMDAALQYACAHGRVDAARVLLGHNRVRFADGLAIQFAATCGIVELVSLLLADPRVTERYDLESALVDASREGHATVVEVLLSDSRLRITSGTAIHEAADRGHLDVLKLLLLAPVIWQHPDALDLQVAFLRASRHGHYAIIDLFLNDPRVPLPRNGAITRIDQLPRRSGDTTWCRFLRHYFRHQRVDPTADGNQLLLDACLQAKRGVVDSLLRSGRVSVDATTVDAVKELVRLSTTRSLNHMPVRRVCRYLRLVEDLQQHSKRVKGNQLPTG